MFTGIVEEIGRIGNIMRGHSSIRLLINCAKILEDAKIGDSIAVNGICLTVMEQGKGFFLADIMPETMRRTTLYNLQVSDPVNLERALKYTDRFGGHFVSGHIDDIGTVANRVIEDNAVWLTIQASENILRYIIMKGSVALDGISLTVADVNDNSFKVSMIPHTASVTILGSKRAGDLVNIECDVIAKYIEKLLVSNNHRSTGKKDISTDFLKENGFL